jgi:hypothetical protein
MPVALNSTQLEILKLFRDDQPEEELQEIKSLLIAYLANNRNILEEPYNI